MKFLEKDLEDIIFNSPKDKLIERGLPINKSGKLFRQFRIGAYGVIDLINISIERKLFLGRCLDIEIFELKEGTLNIDHLLQLTRYVTGVESYLNHFNIPEVVVKGFLIGSSIDLKSDFCYILGQMQGIHAYTYNYKIDGISFSREWNYTATDYEKQLPSIREFAKKHWRSFTDLSNKELTTDNTPF